MPPAAGAALGPEAPGKDVGSASAMSQLDVAADADSGQRWYTVLESLAQQQATLTSHAVLELLVKAVAAARSDFQWADSGIAPLLQRAEEAAKAGFLDSACKTALGCLDFVRVVERYKQAVSSGNGSSEGKRSSGTCVSGDEAASGDAGDDVAASRSKRQRCDDQHKPAACSAQEQQTEEHQPRRRGEPQASWSGAVKVQLPTGGSAEFCRMTMQVPAPVLPGLPSELVVSSIQPRKDIVRIAGVTCSTCITAAGPQQLAELRQMAQLQLVAVVRLEDCGAILVPYLTDSGNLKAVTFLAAME